MSALHRNDCPEFGPTLRRRNNSQGAADGFDSVLHQHQAEAETPSFFERAGRALEADAIVANRAGESRPRLAEDDGGVRGMRMLGDVRETFLDQTIEDTFYCMGTRCVKRDVHLDGNPITPRATAGKESDRLG